MTVNRRKMPPEHDRGEQLVGSGRQIVHPQRAGTAGVLRYVEDARERGRREMTVNRRKMPPRG